jgi:hypothetical protein
MKSPGIPPGNVRSMMLGGVRIASHTSAAPPTVGQVRELFAGVEAQPVIAIAPRRTDLVGPVEEQRFDAAIGKCDGGRDTGRSGADDRDLVRDHDEASLVDPVSALMTLVGPASDR